MTDIKQQLKQLIPDGDGYNSPYAEIISKAIDHIEQLEQKNARYCLTVKGFIGSLLEMDFDEIDNFWEQLTQFVNEEAERQGYSEGIPAIIMKDGGVCTLVLEQEQNE